MHSINVTKQQDPQLRAILQREHLAFDAYDMPSTYTIISFDAEITLTLVEEIKALSVESGTTFDWQKVKTDGSEKQRNLKFYYAYGKALEEGNS